MVIKFVLCGLRFLCGHSEDFGSHWIQYAAARFKILVMQMDQNETPYKKAHKQSTVILVIFKVKKRQALYVYSGITCQIQILCLNKENFPNPN